MRKLGMIVRAVDDLPVGGRRVNHDDDVVLQ